MAEPKRLLLIDGHALAYRAYHAISPLTSPSGEPTNAIYGFASMLLKAINDYPPDYVILTLDAGRTFRHEMYPAYKANRPKMPDDLRVQIKRIQELVETLGIPTYTKEGYEADDILGTLARQAEAEDLDTIIVTGDTDTFQLITPLVHVLAPQGRMGDALLYDETRIQERYGLKPDQLVDYKALKGDPSDNIPGVAGVGEKGAAKLVAEYGSVEGVYKHLDEIKPERTRLALERGADAACESKKLVAIDRNVPDIKLSQASRWGDFDRSAVMKLLREFGFTSLVGRIPGGRVETPIQGQLQFTDTPTSMVTKAPALGDYHIVDTEAKLIDLAEKLGHAPLLALDTETSSTNAMRARLVGISLAFVPGEAYYLPIFHDTLLGRDTLLELELVIKYLGPLLADPKLPKAMHNADFDMIVLAQHGLPVAGVTFDTMIAAWLLEPEGRGLGLKNQAFTQLGVEMTQIEELIGKGKNQKTMDMIPVSEVAPYASADADMTLRLVDKLRPVLEERKQIKLFEELEIPLIPVLTRMEMHGMVVDPVALQRMSSELRKRLDETTQQIYHLAGHPFNINSSKQLADVLFTELKLQTGRRTQTGYSTDAAVMEELRQVHPIVQLILDQRQMDKLKSTYLDALPSLINPATGRIHTSFNQAGTSTGRLSSSDPNLQNIPVRTELGKQVRSAFVAPEGCLLLSCDYSQIELRLLAHLSEDPEMVGAFLRGEDVHASTAAAIFGIALDEVTSSQRALAKTINFGLMYGMGNYGLSARTDLSVEDASKFIEAYFGRFKRIKEYLDEIKQFARTNGYVETILGRRRYFPILTKPTGEGSSMLRQQAERAAINMPIQGSAADMIKLAMIQLDTRLKKEGLQACMVLQVHDELVLEVPVSELERAKRLVVETMENALPLRVPVKVDAAIGNNWMEMK
ncbi:MAG: DNA polymerase I [Chloroflexi bacterium]|nr:DNA polymerase I [Chloroflexota bacterium]